MAAKICDINTIYVQLYIVELWVVNSLYLVCRHINTEILITMTHYLQLCMYQNYEIFIFKYSNRFIYLIKKKLN